MCRMNNSLPMFGFDNRKSFVIIRAMIFSVAPTFPRRLRRPRQPNGLAIGAAYER